MSNAAPLISGTQELPPIVAESPAMRRAVELARRFAPTKAPILLVGPTGSGKELFAQHIHAWSGRQGDVVDINCGALPKDLVEGELFGWRKGSFSGAVETTKGLVEGAHNGTLFLDEICSLPMDTQVKFLRVLETGTVRRVGETEKRHVDFRLISASQDHLGARAVNGTFRLDLQQRVAGLVISLPPLAQRPEDIVHIARGFAAANCLWLDPAAYEPLLRYSWPGNVRELRTVIDRAAWLADEDGLDRRSVEEAIALGATQQATAVGPVVDERAALLAVCEAEGWCAAAIAARLSVGRTTLYRRLKDQGISLQAQKKVFRISGRMA